MATYPQRDFLEKPADPGEPPHIETPVIDIQDLEHRSWPDTRVSNKGLKVEPRIDVDDMRDLAKEDEEAIEALEELERTIRRQAPN